MLTVERAGIDTWSPAWYLGYETRAARAADQLANIGSRRGRLLEERVEGHRIGFIPSINMLWAEGHPAGGDRLGTAEELGEVIWRLEQGLWDRGIQVQPKRARSRLGGDLVSHRNVQGPGFAGVRRLDLSCDLRFDTQAEGLAVLAGVHALGLPRAKTFAYHAVGTGNRPLETVAFHGPTGGKVLARWYDKGVEAGSAPRGTLIRAEDQRRFVKETRRDVDEITTSYVRERYRERFRPMWEASEGVTVGGAFVLGHKLAELVESGDVSDRQAESLAGFLLLDQVGVALGTERTRYRRRQHLRQHGLVLADGVMQEVEVDLGQVMEQLLEAEPWERQG